MHSAFGSRRAINVEKTWFRYFPTECARDRDLYKLISYGKFVNDILFSTLYKTHYLTLGYHALAVCLNFFKVINSLIVLTKLKKPKKLEVQYFCLWRSQSLAHPAGLDHNEVYNIFDRFCIENTAYYVHLEDAKSFLHAFFVLCIDVNFKMKFKFFFPEIWEGKFGSVTHTHPSSARSQSYKKYFLRLEKSHISL